MSLGYNDFSQNDGEGIIKGAIEYAVTGLHTETAAQAQAYNTHTPHTLPTVPLYILPRPLPASPPLTASSQCLPVTHLGIGTPQVGTLAAYQLTHTYTDTHVIWSDARARRRTHLQTERRGRELRTENWELYYTRTKILDSCLFLQSVPANLHASGLYIK